jgi:hypothetical protein
LNKAQHADEILAWGEVNGDYEEEEFHTPLRSLMKEFGIVVAP